MSWIKCSERLPEKFGKYLILTSDNQMECAQFSGRTFDWKKVAYWQPLPEIPKEMTAIDEMIATLEYYCLCYLNSTPCNLGDILDKAKKIKDRHENA